MTNSWKHSFFLLFSLLIITLAGRLHAANTEEYFEFKSFATDKNVEDLSYFWSDSEGFVTIQNNKASFYNHASKEWSELKNENTFPEKTEIQGTGTGQDKFFVIQNNRLLSWERQGEAIIKKDDEVLPLEFKTAKILAIANDVFIFGTDKTGNNVFLINSKAEEVWSKKPVNKILPTSLNKKLYLFVEEGGDKQLTSYAYNTYSKKWDLLATSPFAVDAEMAISCGDAHIIFPTKGSKQLQSLYVTQKQWVTFDLKQALPEKSYFVGMDRQFLALAPNESFEISAVFPGTKYGFLDHMVVASFFLLMLWIGKKMSKNENSEEDFFRGGNRLPWWAVGLSMFATGASAISLMSMPAKAYAENWLYFIGGPIQILLLPIVYYITIPIVRHLNFSSAYEYLEARYCSFYRIFGSFGFIATQIIGRMAGVMILPAIALSVISGMPITVSIIIMGSITTAYCMMGGFEAVVWTDTIQAAVMIIAIALCVTWIFLGLEVPVNESWALIQSEQKLKMIEWSLDITQPIILIMVITSLLMNLQQIGDQNFIQRAQALPNIKEARKAVTTQLFVAVPINILLFGLGTCLFLYYHHNSADIPPAMKADGIYPLFAAQNLPTGLAGLVVAALMAATMSTLSSALNSVSNVTLEDYIKKFKPDMSHKQQLNWGKGLTIGFGILGTALSLFMATFNSISIWDLLTVILGLVFSPLSAMFLVGILTTRTNSLGLFLGVVTGTAINFYIQGAYSIHPFFLPVIGTLSCFLLSYLFSFITPQDKSKDLTGLTIFTSSYLRRNSKES